MIVTIFQYPKSIKLANNEWISDKAEVGLEDLSELTIDRETCPKRKAAVTGEIKRRFAV